MALPKIWGLNERLTSANLNAQFAYCDSLVPIGTILPFYDFDETVEFDTDIFTYCNGAVVSDVNSPLDTLTLPDMSNRYLVGFGTENGGNIGTAAWSATPVGNASHQANLQHLHAQTAHAHPMPHTHTISHTHSLGAGHARLDYTDPGSDISWQRKGVSAWTQNFKLNSSWGGSISLSATAGVALGGTTDGASSDNTGAVSTANTSPSAAVDTGSSLSTTQSIQPRSVSVRYIIRYK
jgi:hypothetical protein